MIVESFYSQLASDSTITNLASKIYPHWIPQNASLPAISFRLEADDRDHILDGTGSLKTALFDVDCWAESYKTAHQIADAVEASLSGHTGAIGASSPIAERADHIRLERTLEFIETDRKPILYRVSKQFFVAYY